MVHKMTRHVVGKLERLLSDNNLALGKWRGKTHTNLEELIRT